MRRLPELAQRLNALRDELRATLHELAQVKLDTPLSRVRRLKDAAERTRRTIARLERRLR